MASFGFLVIWRNAPSVNDMSKEMDFSLVEFTLVRVEGEACYLNLRQSSVQTAIMLLLGVTKNEHVIHVT